MCYDISFDTSNIRSLEDYFPDLHFDDQIVINYELTAHLQSHGFGNHPIIYINRDDLQPHCRLMEWSVIPHYTKDEDKFKIARLKMANARSERIIGDKTSYWYKIRNRRCLIPVTGAYEHRGVAGWKKKVPYHISVKGERIFFMPGLYAVVELPDKSTGEMIKRYTWTLVTREPICNIAMKNIHNSKEDGQFRMPLFMPLDRAKDWLTEGLSDPEIQERMNYELPEEAMEYFPVDTIRTTKPRADGKRKNDPFEWANLPALGEMNPD
ncbi:SOS response-associated peptidase [Sediminibacterium roseum]|uniref:Abasic site processing protein n=1 Tax=Sediminibacterium roseum TaxID=1978412 RepID=A0ABW9ZW57_9BACT|nr:SOS response-associated peptidase family protein [Sediminibacterium roseum]NCI51374.1 SOS response-associated peptidase [Sediminibacterium roseum]